MSFKTLDILLRLCYEKTGKISVSSFLPKKQKDIKTKQSVLFGISSMINTYQKTGSLSDIFYINEVIVICVTIHITNDADKYG